MANPQPDEFTRISNELYTAIMQTDFSKRQRNILDLVIRMSYGCNKKSALLKPVDFEVVGVYKTHVRKELDYLVQAKVLFMDGDTITLNKDYDQWRVSLARGAADRKKFDAILHRNLKDKAVTKTVTGEDEKVTETVTEVTKTVTTLADESYQNSNHEVTKTVTGCASEANGDAGSQPRKESIKEITIYPNTNNNAREKQANIFQQFQAEFGRPLSPTEFEQIQNWEQEMPTELVVEALKRAVLNGKFSFKYIDRILLEWQKNNIRTLLDVRRQDEEFEASKSKGSNKPRAPNKRDGPQKEEDDQKEFYRTLYMG